MNKNIKMITLKKTIISNINNYFKEDEYNIFLNEFKYNNLDKEIFSMVSIFNYLLNKIIYYIKSLKFLILLIILTFLILKYI
jgi:hypothetical protein